jgi:hypothetical protein
MSRLLSLFALVASSILVITPTMTDAYAFSTSSFAGGLVLQNTIQNGCNMEMKKGKDNVPIQMRGQYKKQQEMASMQKQMVSNSKAGPDGFPVFNLFVRTQKANVCKYYTVLEGKEDLLVCLTHFLEYYCYYYFYYRCGILAVPSRATNDRQHWPNPMPRLDSCRA